MSTVASRDLRNHTADVLRQVAEGTSVTITVNGRAVAELSPIRSARSTFMPKVDLLWVIANKQADPGMNADLDLLSSGTTEELDAL